MGFSFAFWVSFGGIGEHRRAAVLDFLSQLGNVLVTNCPGDPHKLFSAFSAVLKPLLGRAGWESQGAGPFKCVLLLLKHLLPTSKPDLQAQGFGISRRDDITKFSRGRFTKGFIKIISKPVLSSSHTVWQRRRDCDNIRFYDGWGMSVEESALWTRERRWDSTGRC